MFGPFKKPSRLGQWNGRGRSSRSDDPVMPYLVQRAVLLRLGAVLTAVLGATYLAHDWGGLMSFRVGEVRPHDLRARVYFEVVDEEETARKRDEAVQSLPLEEQRNHKKCEEIRKGVEPVKKSFSPGTLLVERNFPITA